MNPDAIAELRATLFAAVSAVMDEGHALKYVPRQVVSPMLWLERPRITPRTTGRNTVLTICTFRIVIVVDGDVEGQQELLDPIVAQVWDAALGVRLSEPVAAGAYAVDIGGPSATAMFVDIESTITARTLCGSATPEEAVA